MPFAISIFNIYKDECDEISTLLKIKIVISWKIKSPCSYGQHQPVFHLENKAVSFLEREKDNSFKFGEWRTRKTEVEFWVELGKFLLSRSMTTISYTSSNISYLLYFGIKYIKIGLDIL
jgi:hypothetical protein